MGLNVIVLPMAEIQLGLTFDDVLLLPCLSTILPGEADPSSQLVPGFSLRLPILSAPLILFIVCLLFEMNHSMFALTFSMPQLPILRRFMIIKSGYLQKNLNKVKPEEDVDREEALLRRSGNNL